jgi:hypothetical protein
MSMIQSKSLSLSSKISAKVIDRVTNPALYGETNEEIVTILGAEINGVTVTERWVRFLANLARHENGMEI